MIPAYWAIKMGAVSLVQMELPKEEDGPKSTQIIGKTMMLEMRKVKAMKPAVSSFS